MQVFDEILTAARTLTPADRIRLAEVLWDDVPPSDWPLPSAEWLAVAQQRSEDFDQGRSSGSLWSEVRERARKKAGLDG